MSGKAGGGASSVSTSFPDEVEMPLLSEKIEFDVGTAAMKSQRGVLKQKAPLVYHGRENVVRTRRRRKRRPSLSNKDAADTRRRSLKSHQTITAFVSPGTGLRGDGAITSPQRILEL